MPTPSDTTPITDQQPIDEALKKRNKDILGQVQNCKQFRRKLVANWAVSIDYRRGKPFASQSDEDRVAVNLDWALTSEKQAILFSQVPAIRVNHPPQTIAQNVIQWLHAFEQKINDESIKAGIETAMDECLPDCINAAGIGIIMVSREVITEDVELPSMDMATMPPELHQMIMQSGMMPDGTPVPMETVPRVIDSRYRTARVSPADFLWPVNFTGSDFDDAPWVGRSGRISWASAVKRFKLKGDKQQYLGEDRNLLDRLSPDIEKEKGATEEMVSYDEIFYREEQFDPEAKSFSTIHHLVFVGIKETPVIDEPWKGQQLDPESGQLIGAMRFPVRVLSLSYITDDAIPPSDSAIVRPQINEINKSRSQRIQQRAHSLPIRWINTDRVDPTIQHALMRGVWQHMIPVQGSGENSIGEVPRSAMPMENFTFDRIAKDDYREIAGLGQEDSGRGVETGTEAKTINANVQTRISRQRAKVGKFFCSIAEVLGGLICIYEDPSTFGEGFTPLVSKTLAYSILADSTILLDSNQRLKRLMDFINFTAKSGWVDEESVLKEVATLSGLDPNVVIRPPSPKPPAEPNISLRLTGTEDMMNPLTLAFLINSGQAPSTKQIEDAKQMILAAVTPPPNAPGMTLPLVAPGGETSPDVQPPVPGGPPPGTLPPVGPAGPPMPVMPPPPAPPTTGSANPGWGPMDRINRRVVERGE